MSDFSLVNYFIYGLININSNDTLIVVYQSHLPESRLFSEKIMQGDFNAKIIMSYFG